MHAAKPFRDGLILLVIPESRSDIRDPVPLRITALRERHQMTSFPAVENRRDEEDRG
jgi:hypothetical protein